MSAPGAVSDEGCEPIHGYRIYWKSVGAPGPRGTVVVLHGGPGATHDYLQPFSDLAADGYRVIYYDQLGCGRSELARSEVEYSVDRDVEDLEALRTSLGLGTVHLIGSSYGGMLAIAYTLAHPEGVRTLVSASGLADVPLTRREMQGLKRQLPADVQAVMARHEALGEYQHPEYLRAVLVFYRNFLCRMDPWPAEVSYSLDHISLPKYGHMNGPNEFTITGTIREYDATPRLPEIRAPTLVTVGRYDEVTPVVAESIHRGISGSEMVVFEHSAHLAFWEERERYFRVLGDFLRRRG